MSRWKFLGIAASVLSGAAATCGAQTYFDLWFEAPETVLAGETFTVGVWAEASGQWGSEPEFCCFNFALMSVEVTGDLGALQSLSPATIYTNFPWDAGTPDGPWLRDVQAYNNFSAPFATRDNPLQFVSFEVTTSLSQTGSLLVNFHSSSVSPHLVALWANLPGGEMVNVGSADENSILTARAFAVRVIPAPSGVAVLALAGFSSRRRR